MPIKTEEETVFIYKLKGRREFYKRHNKGTWAVRSEGVSGKEIITDDIAKAERFKEKPGEMPYLHSRLRGGRYLKVKITTTYEVQDEQ